MKLKKYIPVLIALALAGNAQAAITVQSQNFTGAGAVPAGYTFTVSGGYVTNDLDAGDGLNDGAIFVRGNDAGTPLSLVTFDFSGAISLGEQYKFTTNLFQSNLSFGQTDVRLLVDGVSVTSVDPGNIVTAGNNVVLNYTPVAGDVGKTLSFSVSSKRNAGGSSSQVGIDNWNLAIPEPSSTALISLAGLGLILRRRRA